MTWFFLLLGAGNDAGDITSDAGLLLVSLSDEKLGLTEAISDVVLGSREQCKVVRGIIEMSRERIYAICQDYEGTLLSADTRS